MPQEPSNRHHTKLQCVYSLPIQDMAMQFTYLVVVFPSVNFTPFPQSTNPYAKNSVPKVRLLNKTPGPNGDFCSLKLPSIEAHTGIPRYTRSHFTRFLYNAI